MYSFVHMYSYIQIRAVTVKNSVGHPLFVAQAFVLLPSPTFSRTHFRLYPLWNDKSTPTFNVNAHE